MKYTRKCLAALIALLASLMLWADGGELFTSGKLSSSLINCVVQDKYGYIWVGTEYGLSKFDGYRFTNYLHDEKDTTSITSTMTRPTTKLKTLLPCRNRNTTSCTCQNAGMKA